MAKIKMTCLGVAKALAAAAAITIAGCTTTTSDASPAAEVDRSQPADPHAGDAAPQADLAARIKKKVDDLVQQAQDLRSQQKYEEALARLNEALAVDPGNPGVQAIKDVVEDQIIIQKNHFAPPPEPRQAPATQPGDQGHAANEAAVLPDRIWFDSGNGVDGSFRLIWHGESDADRNIAAKLKERISIDFMKTKLGNVIDSFRNFTKVNIFVNWTALAAIGIDPDTPVSFQFANLTTGQALKLILQGASNAEPAGYIIRDGLIKISTEADIKAATPHPANAPATKPGADEATQPGAAYFGAGPASQPEESWGEVSIQHHHPSVAEFMEMDRKIAVKLREPIPVDFKDNKLGNVIDYIRKITGVNIFVNWTALAPIEIDSDTKVTLQLTSIPAGQALKLILQSVGIAIPDDAATYAIHDGILIISTEEDIKTFKPYPTNTPATKPGADAATQPAAAWDKQSEELAARDEAKRIAKANQSTAAKLQGPIPINFKANKLGNVIDYIRNITGVNIYVNWKALAAIDVSPDTEVTLQLNNIPADQALKLVLKAVSPTVGTKRVAYTLDEGLVVISTEEAVKPPATAPADASSR